ncbi:MAG: hypothetical protein HW380_2126 [Magnetococcales bacterium]|nr:hypothetical protein [Magnetococcales bacterium]
MVLNQRGSAMLAVLALLVAVLGAAFYQLLEPHPQRLADREGTMRRLAEAIFGLRAFAGQSEGKLPCPDLDFPPDGYANAECVYMRGRVVGWLPWRTLGLGPLRDEGGNFFWYAVAGGFLMGRGADVIDRSLRMEGLTDLEVAAVVIAPGWSLLGQDKIRNEGVGEDRVRGWLEGRNSVLAQTVTTGVFEQRMESLEFNDRVLPLLAGQGGIGGG